MSSTFFGFNISRSGIFASQRALSITSHNIANANTKGYTRQRLDIKQSSPMLLPNGQGMLGTGVETENISQLRNEFLDFKFRGENSVFGEWGGKSEVLQNIETIFNEPSDSGIQTVLDEFFGSLQELTKNPESLTTRALVRQRAISFSTSLNHMAEQFEKLQTDTDFEITTTVDKINGYSGQIRKLNELIFNAELSGSKANDLRDQRNLLLDELSELVNIDYYEDNQGRFNVLINGKALVSHFRNTELTYSQRGTKLNAVDAPKLNDVTWKDGSTFNPTSGEIKGLIDMRDNISGNDKGIPYYMEKLNEFADTFATAINNIHDSGFGLVGSTGNYLFTVNGMDTATFKATIPVPKITAKDISISWDIENDLNNIAASTDLAGVPGNGDNALAMADVRHDTSLFAWGGPEDFVKSLISNLGVDTQQAIRMEDNQTVLLNQVETNRQSISGVSMDEEMTNMIQFQHSFNANSRMITTLDEMIDTIINRMGTVGR